MHKPTYHVKIFALRPYAVSSCCTNHCFADYDSPGTVELVLNRKTFRVGQSYFSGADKQFIYTIAMIQPILRKARCYKYMHIDKSFVCPKGHYEDSYVVLGEEFSVELSLLKMPCAMTFKKFPMKYSQEDETQRTFSYFNDTAKMLHHPDSRPAVCECVIMNEVATTLRVDIISPFRANCQH